MAFGPLIMSFLPNIILHPDSFGHSSPPDDHHVDFYYHHFFDLDHFSWSPGPLRSLCRNLCGHKARSMKLASPWCMILLIVLTPLYWSRCIGNLAPMHDLFVPPLRQPRWIFSYKTLESSDPWDTCNSDVICFSFLLYVRKWLMNSSSAVQSCLPIVVWEFGTRHLSSISVYWWIVGTWPHHYAQSAALWTRTW